MQIDMINTTDNRSIILVDFRDIDQKDVGEIKLDPKKIYDMTFDSTTCIYYKSYRIDKIDPITFEPVDVQSAFKYPNMWDCHTGKILESDPYGPLYFNPINLMLYYYHSRLQGLWNPPQNGYQGYYGDLVGSGEDCYVANRGTYPERYLFRLPIYNCYLKKEHNLNTITMGPKLTDREICQLDRLIVKYYSQHPMYRYYTKIGSLFKLKHYYDVAISKDPFKMDLTGLDLGDRDYALKQKNPIMYINRLAVDKIKQMI